MYSTIAKYLFNLKFCQFGIFLILFINISSYVQAHDRSESFSKWQWQENGILSVTFSVLSKEITALPSVDNQYRQSIFDTALVNHFIETVEVTNVNSNTVCQLQKVPLSIQARKGYSRLEAQFFCSSSTQSIDINMAVFQSVISNHVHYAMIQSMNNGNKAEYLFSNKDHTQRIDLMLTPNSQQKVELPNLIWNYVIFGVKHILTGLDHLLFLLGIMLVARSFKTLIWMITGFTLGHTASLISTTLGYVIPPMSMVESFIGFSIFVMACEAIGNKNNFIFSFVFLLPITVALLQGFSEYFSSYSLSLIFMAIFSFSYLMLSNNKQVLGHKLKASLTMLFGIIHGFGFASGFIEMGMNNQMLLWKIAAFNIGVEIGQIIILLTVGAVFILLAAINADKIIKETKNISVTVIACMGLFWFLQRSF